jgi:inner membrane protein
MQKSLLKKLFTILALMLLLSIPLLMIESTIRERLNYRDQAVRSIAEDSVGEQTLFGPIIVIPYTEYFMVEELESAQSKIKVQRQRSETRNYYIYPSELNITSVVDTDHRYRGIHKVLIYHGKNALTGKFDLPKADMLKKNHTQSHIEVGQAYVSIGLSDTRGLRNTPSIVLDGKSYEFTQNSQLNSYKHGIHAPINFHFNQNPTSISFSLQLAIDGIEQLAFIPLGKNTQVSLQSTWPHPQFFGRFLPSPKERKISKNGFSANWNISSLSSQAQQQFLRAELINSNTNVSAEAPSVSQPQNMIDTFGVAFIEPINIYSQSDRAIKYGLLFIALTFSAFFLFEILKQLPIHPIQYSLVGMALAIFFLLLVSLSEHILFLYAYLIASAACILLIGIYLAHVLNSKKRGYSFATALTVLYAVLYGLLQSENNALVLGSMLLFGILTAIMMVTRKIDWYQLGKMTPQSTPNNNS